MAKISILAKIVAPEGKGDELLRMLPELVDAAGPEPGTEAYVLNRSTTDPDTFWFFELYADQDALTAHAGSETLARAMGELGSLGARTEIVLSEPLAAKGLTV
ncbi:MAG: antibiotic biosynthesis monooxygenase [Acidimicrobiia bacterium]|nr:antibiotic biosynthesis monooxygenase [Acidimicrobiia bacterium]